MIELAEIPLDPAGLGLPAGTAEAVEHLGRRCLRLAEGFHDTAIPGLELAEGVIELDLAVSAERAFHGLNWHINGDDYEQFYVRPHQVGNPDAIQYTPVTNGISSWQLYHGPGYWAPITFPLDAWFTIRVEIAGRRADVYVGDLDVPALAVRELLLGAARGGVGLGVGGPALHVGRLAVAHGAPRLAGEPPPEPATEPGTIMAWEVSDPFPEAAVAGQIDLPPSLVAARRWTTLAAEPGGLANLSRVSGIVDARNTVLARATLDAPGAAVRALQLGFSDRTTVFLNGSALFRGEDGYRSRDYRFLGSIGWWDTVYLPLEPGPNELVIAVSEDFGGWGVQARFADATG